jgi:hypothetical protein
MNEKLIELKDLPSNFKVYLDADFRKELISEAVKKTGGFVKLSKKINFDWSSLCKLRRGYRFIGNRKSLYFIKISLLKKLLVINNTSFQEAEKKVVGIAYSKTLVYTKLPIFSSPELASLVGHALGDGHVSCERFKYVNQRKELVEEVIQYTNLIFGHNGKRFFYNGCYCVEFPGVIGRLLQLVEVPLGRKVIQEFEIPSWIRNGSQEIKSAFLRALFDDEGSMINGKYSNFISISMYKHKNLVNGHIKFLNEIRTMLNDFEITPTKVSFKKDWNDTKEFGFRIYNKKSLINFARNVKFNHAIKNKKLISTINILNQTKSI